MSRTRRSDARRVTLRPAKRGTWRYRVQGANWRVIETGEIDGVRPETAERKAAKIWPDAEIVVVGG